MSRPIGPPPHRIPEPDSQSRDSAEELREALIDLDRARAHERQMRLQTEGLLEGLRVLTRAENTRQMFDELTTVLQRFVPFEAAFLMQADEGSDRFEVTQSTCRDFEGSNWTAEDMLRRVATGKIVAAFDVTALPEWQAQPPSVRERVRSAIHVPLRTGTRCAVLVFTHSRTAFFDRHHVDMLERFAPLTTQAMASMEYRARLEAHATRIEYMAKHDALTGLPNRTALADRVEVLAAHAHRAGELLVLLFLDLDRFKHVNDTFGHGVGDALLKVIAKRLREAVRESDTVARLGGDEFVILLTGITEVDAVNAVVAKILATIEQPVVVEDQTLFVSASIGAAICPADGEDVASLLKNADVAMYRAKEEGRNGVRFYAPEMSESARVQFELESALRQALTLGEFELHYQPRIHLELRELVGMEALLRWRHPQRGLVMPCDFIAAAEENGLIVQIGEWVIARTCAQSRAWQDAGLPALPVAVNVSGRQMHKPQEFLDHVSATLARAGLPGTRLEIELTESVVMQYPAQMIDVLHRLRWMGVRIALDDFGTGHSSLSYLKRFPVDMLKIDGSFVRDLAIDGDDAAIARAIVSMGHALGLRVVAEGVEDEAQLNLLRQMGCDEAQGFLFSPPLPAHEMEACMRRSASRGAGTGQSISGAIPRST
ncbi:diguanylate cyclase (GGDEF) domain-containing protein [Burkholderia sp. D7]|nr:diguanylate cyclase (GGDEF) domain-containing protein [Burkholderia sp. D7]